MSLILDYSSAIRHNIDEAYTRCLNSLKDLIVQLTGPPNNGLHRDKRDLPRALEAYGRLRTWGEESRAALPAGSRESLDHALRQDEKLRNSFVKTLAKIQRQVLFASDALESSCSGTSESQHEEEDDFDTDSDFETSSENDDGNEQRNDRGKTKMVLTILRQVNADMDLLTQMSVLMKRPGFNRKYLHSTGMAKLDSRVAMYHEHDLLHVQEKLLHWQMQIFRCDGNEAVASPEWLMQRASLEGSPGGRHVLLQRLATANTRRREQLLYWSRHPDQIPITTGHTSHVKAKVPEIDSAKQKERKEANTGATQNPTDGVETESHALKSTMTKNTYSTVAASAIPGTSPATNPEGTIYAESTVGNRRSNRVPDVPQSSRSGIRFECPYCHLELDSLKMQDRQQWKRHVFRDLRPYICTFEHCQSADKQYSTRRDWEYHELQTHRRQWICKQHDTTFAIREAFSNHILERHMSSIALDQLPVLVEMSERPMDEMTIVRCPLCPDERRLMTLHSHIAEHLEAISLFVLPLNIEGDNQDEDNSDNVVDGDFSSRMEDSVSSMSSLGEEIRDLSQSDDNTYLKIAVKIIRWDESRYDLRGLTEEINRLQSTFQNLGYDCSVHYMRVTGDPQVDLNDCVRMHLVAYDDPRNLVIFYYIGHANVINKPDGKRYLELSANDDKMHVAYWHEAEEPILSKMRGDALTIMDCCFASSAALHPRSATDDMSVAKEIFSTMASSSKLTEEDTRIRKKEDDPSYYLFAATTEDGFRPSSFTTVLCNALKELIAESDGGPFDLNQLSDRINKKQPVGTCLVWDRTQASRSHPQLGRVGRARHMRRPSPRLHLADVVQEVIYMRRAARQWIQQTWNKNVSRTGDRTLSEKRPQLYDVAMKVKLALRFIDILRPRVGAQAHMSFANPKASVGAVGKIHRGYHKVEVLIIRWDVRIDEYGRVKDARGDEVQKADDGEEYDRTKEGEGSKEQSNPQRQYTREQGVTHEVQHSDFKQQDHEIDRLRAILVSGFGYGCKDVRIEIRKKPQHQLAHAISKHVYNHDGNNTLLIVYYMDGDPRGLELSAGLDAAKFSDCNAAAVWNKAHDLLTSPDLEADVLAILDCQYQHAAAFKGNSDHERVYQLLARSSDTSMDDPGESSFTTALCDSLEELLGESKDQSFAVTMLLERINTKRNSHAAQLWDRLPGGFRRNIELSRIRPPLEEDISISEEE